MKILLIAYGNPYRGDDGIGAWILQKGDRLLYFKPEGDGRKPFCHAEPRGESGLDESTHRQDSFTSLRSARGQVFEDRPLALPQDDRKESEERRKETEDRKEGIEGVKKVTSSVDKLVLQELTLDLAETLAQYNLVVFIDAAISGQPVTWRELKADNVSSPLSHHLPPEKLLFYAELLYQKAPYAFLLSVRGDSFEFEEHLSPAAEKNSWLALKQLEDFLQKGDRLLFEAVPEG
jgi:Ni,Fe-hydrogenase maturation factor